MSMTGLWLKVLKNPKEVFSTEKVNGTLQNGAKNLLVLSLILAVVYLIGAFGFLIFFNLPIFIGLILIPLVLILFPIQMIIGVLIQSLILYVIGKVFGGKGNFEQLFYLYSILYSGMFVLFIPLMIFFLIGVFLGQVLPIIFGAIFIVFWILFIVLIVYVFYLTILLVKEVFEFSTLKALGVLLIPAIIPLFIIGIVFSSLVFTSDIGFGGLNINYCSIFGCYVPEKPNDLIAVQIFNDFFSNELGTVSSRDFTADSTESIDNKEIARGVREIAHSYKENVVFAENLAEEQVCVMLSDEISKTGDFVVQEQGEIIKYVGQPQKFRFTTVCNTKQGLEDFLSKNFVGEPKPTDIFDLNKCPNIELSLKEIFCLVSVSLRNS